MQPELFDFIKKIKDLGYLVKLDTNGSHPEVLKSLCHSNTDRLCGYGHQTRSFPLSGNLQHSFFFYGKNRRIRCLFIGRNGAL